MAHAPLLRNNTAPVFESSLNGTGGILPNSMNNAPRTSQLSGSTAYAVPGVNGGPVMATANIINQKADASRSLYQICVSLRQRLSLVPGFEPYLQQLDPNDPVDPLWNLLRSGHPLLDIYNSLQPPEPLKVDDVNASEAKRSKIAIFKFVQACMKELRVPPSESFVITDLMGNDTSGFVKVTQVVNLVLDHAEKRGLLLQQQPYPDDEPTSILAGSQMSYRDHIVKELVDTERKYVQDLENLHDLKKSLEQKGDIPGDSVYQIFLNIHAILDFQRRFLIRVETTNSMPAAIQRWGAPFCYYEDAFDIYLPFIANQRKAAKIANQVFDKIQLSDHPVAADFNTLDGFLLKPMQRLVKYPLLLKDLHKKTEDPEIKGDLMKGCEAAERVLHKANEAVNRDLLDEATESLMSRMEDWGDHDVDGFGRLVMHSSHRVIPGKLDQEREYEVYLFEHILLCCKECSPSKSKDKKDRTRSSGLKSRSNKNKQLRLKGKIYLCNVFDVVSWSKPGSHNIQLCWRCDNGEGIDNLLIKYGNEETMRKWAIELENLRRLNARRMSVSRDGLSSDFSWTRDHAGSLENPYLHPDEDTLEDYGSIAMSPQYQTSIGMSRTSSSSNLRQRSATGDSAQSLASIARAPPPRFPLTAPRPPLSLQTPGNGAPSPGYRAGESFFSPGGDSPVSSRTSAASGMFPNSAQFSKAGMQQLPWDDSIRYTAPAMPRAPSRDGPVSNPYAMNSRNPRGPSLPAMATQGQGSLQQQRGRSYSTPDVNATGIPRQRQPSQGNIPAVPGIPQHLHPAHDTNIPRSQTGSPRGDLPIRTSTQSPGVQRERLHKHSGSLGGTMAQFPAQPVYQRPNAGAPPGATALRVDSAAANSRTVSPALGTGSLMPQSGTSTSSNEMPPPSQLKVRVNCDSGNYVTLVVAFNITYQSLIDRIDAKLARFMNSSIGKGMLKLRYRDEDGDFVAIESDEDIQIAFLEWREGVRNMYSGGVGEIELFCVGEST
ncbi:hypothetical protein CDD81_1324 [Ophiocordyceps australis]|uniref:DH domain-containing protein n=1 Tax=Ophiocordyceps australis TaxID=1399860 RepID=A0A2C5XZ57_9HYPO|nr:hypothetical protein CDD81_1324 [Ophiocordyceps australis]